MEQLIKSIISQVIKLNEKYELISKMNGDNFNIFSILDMERNEVQTHSKFIYELLNPLGSHNQGELFLKCFFEEVLELPYENYLSVKREDFTTYIKNGKRIDFTIETQAYQIGIEMKIDAADQDRQLLDYHFELSKRITFNQEAKLFYLTLTGYDANDNSKKELEHDIDYKLISFEVHILNWIDKCIEKSSTIPTLREGIIQYRNLLRKLTNTLPIDMEKDMENLVRDSGDVKAMHVITEEYPTLWAKKEMQFWQKLWDEILSESSTLGFELKDRYEIFYDKNGIKCEELKVIDNIKDLRNKNGYAVGFAINKSFKNFEVDLYVLELDETISYYLVFSKNNKGFITPELELTCQNIGFTGRYQNERYKYSKNKITFYGRYQPEPTYDLFELKKFNIYVEHIKNETMDILKDLLNNQESF